MKAAFASLASLSILAAATLFTSCAGGKPAGNAAAAAKKSTGTAIPDCETAEQIKAMPPCKATVEEHHSCYSIFRTADGRKFSIGSPAATQEVVQFLQTLKVGQTYKFPGVFLDYQKTSPIYETAEQIKAMPRCEATVVHTYPCYSLLRATDGKQFCIGSPGATPEVGNFVETLKDGQTYKFPGAFLTYEKQQPR